LKKVVLAAALGLASFLTVVSTSSVAATATGTFNVNITLTSACKVNSVSDVAMSYTSLQTSAASSTGGAVSLSCTNGLPYTMALDSSSVTDNAVNLAYTLSLSAASGTGNGTAQSYSVSGSISANQAGDCATASCTNTAATNKQRTLTITY
jgi:Spore Coat Protein U domain